MKKVFNFSTVSDGISRFVVESCPYRQGGKTGIYGIGSLKCMNLCGHCVSRNLENNTVTCNFRILDLSLKYHWYDEIESGRKSVEYRELNDYWAKRLLLCRKGCQNFSLRYNTCRFCTRQRTAEYDAVRFHRGQGGKQTMMYEFCLIDIGKGIEQLGAIPDQNMFKIYLGKRLQ